MRIVFDVSPLSHERTGVNNYIRGSLAGLAEAAASGGDQVVAFAPTSPRGRRAIPEALDGIPVELRLKTFLGAHAWRTAWSRAGWPPAERWLGSFDVLHFSDWMYPPQAAGLRATTIHDLVPLHFPQWVTGRTRSMHVHKYRNAARTCDVLFANSAFTADDAAATLGFPREQIVVAHPGIGAEFHPDGPAAEREKPYLLTVATLEPRKNLGTLVEAFALLGGASLRARRRRRRRLGRAAGARPPECRAPRTGRRRRACAALPRRRRGRLPLTVRRVRDADHRGDGLRSPRRRLVTPLARRGRGDGGRALRSREPGGDRGGDRRGARPGATSSARSGSRTRRSSPGARTGETLPRGVPAILVGIDTTPLLQTRAGTARYLRGLLAHLDVPVSQTSFPATSRLRSAAADALWYPRLSVAGADVLHCPTFRGPFASRVPLVVTVHDLAVLRHPEWFNRWTRTYSRRAVPRVVGAAAAVIAVSEFTARELGSLLGVPRAKIRVVPNAVEPVFTPEGPRAEGDYVLAVGTLEPRKNLARIAAAVEGELRVVGARGWGAVEPPANVTRLGEVDDEELARLYRGARCLVYASLYEGFGIPVAEALACGCPVVTSAGSPMAEFAGDDAVYVDPRDVDSIREGIARAFAPAPRRVASWDEVGRATRAVYEELA